METVSKDRFTGFSKIYDEVRPRPPEKVCKILLSYLGVSQIGSILDLGSGTGLSSVIWRDYAQKIVGIEPNHEMRERAQQRTQGIQFFEGTSYDTHQASEAFNVVTCSQSFHWMEPLATIKEVTRVLKPYGLFAIYDCLWPITVSWKSEIAYTELLDTVKELTHIYQEKLPIAKRWPKEKHLENFQKSGKFEYCKNIYFDNVEICDAQRFIGIALSQSSIQTLLKHKVGKIEAAISKFKELVEQDLMIEKEMRVSYQMSIGVKRGNCS